MTRQRRPEGPSWPIDENWKRSVLAIMKAKGISRSKLAELVGISRASVTTMFQPQTKQTRVKPQIHQALGLLPPESAPAIVLDELFARVLKQWPHLSEEDRESIVQLAGRLARDKPK